MSETTQDKAKATSASGLSQAGEQPPMSLRSLPWKTILPIPALALGVVLFVGGVVMAIKTRPKADPFVPLQRAEAQIEARKFQDAITTLNTDVKKFIEQGTEAGVTQAYRAAYALAIARAFSGAQMEMGFSRRENHEVVVAHFEKAEELGVEIHGADVTRLVESLVALGKLDEAIKRVRTLSIIGPSQNVGAEGEGEHVAEHELKDESSHETEHSSAGDTESDGTEHHGNHAASGGEDLGDSSPDSTDGVTEVQRRIRLTKLVVEANLKSATPRDDLTLELLAELSGIPSLAPEDRVWVLARQAELLIAAGRPEDAIVKLLRRIRINTGSGQVAREAEGELYLLLGRAYFDAGDPQAATKQLEAAVRLLPENSPKRAQSELLLGRIMQSFGDLASAREHFAVVATEFATTDSYLPAILGLAEVEGSVGGSGMGDDSTKELESSIQRYAQIVETLKSGSGRRRDISVERVSASLMQRQQDRFQIGDLMSALRFAQLAESMYADDRVPGEVHIALARVHRKIADDTLADARNRGGPDFKIADLNPVERTEIKQHYLSAADHYHAFAMANAAVDNQNYADALWASGDSYELAGDLEEAKKIFSAYAQGASDDDARKPVAVFRLGQIFEAQHEYPAAAALYMSLREGRGVAARQGETGEWGDRAIVPLARCYLLDDTADNDEEAENLLLSLVDGSVVEPQAREFREALLELGRMYYVQGRYTKAIQRLEEAVARYPEDRRLYELKFRLSDSYRLSAEAILQELRQSLPQVTRQELATTRSQRLRSAITGFRQVVNTLDSRPGSKLDALDRVYLRNAYFYIGDCEFDLEDYDAAVRSYDAARQRYADEPASLVAMVQIVNAYVAQKRWAEARTANERAAQHLARFPDSVWNRPDLPMERRHWDRWLEARTLLDQNSSDVRAGGDGSSSR